LRKALKIKSSIIFLAWLVIFAHSLIPHNHLQEYYKELNNMIHLFGHAADCEDYKVTLESLTTENENVCHLSENLFHNSGCEGIFLTSENITHITRFIESGIAYYFDKNKIITGFNLYSNSLRAPPIVSQA
jgi:hypothetical protein